MKQIPALPRFIFASRWLQLPLYVGLIAAQGVYVFHFWVELVHLIEAAFGSQTALDALVTSIGYKDGMTVTHLSESITMLVVLGLIDVVMSLTCSSWSLWAATKPLSRACTLKTTLTNPSGSAM